MINFRSALHVAISRHELKPYVYSYPSKRSYKELNDINLVDIWDPENTGDVSLYIHIPFCHYRCTYCTLFLTTRYTEDLKQLYVNKICEQLKFYLPYAGNRRVSSIYFGGGTPTVLSMEQFDQIFQTIRNVFRKVPESAEVCVETSPDTVSPELLDKLKTLGVNRISMGIQTMDPAELKASGRPYSIETTISAIKMIKEKFDNLNLDLIYGLSGQDCESWAKSLKYIIQQRPMTISLYPVVSRPLTAIEKQKNIYSDRYLDDAKKLEIYDENIKYLKAEGYRQESFTRFTRLPKEASAYEQEVLDFQGVPMIGIGAGARSNNGKYHYSFDYAVSLKKVGEAINDFIELEFSASTIAQFGAILGEEGERLRYFLLSLTVDKLSSSYYRDSFQRDLFVDFREVISALVDEGCITISSDKSIRLTEKGYKYSNLAAHLLFSDHVKTLEERYIPQ
ncbi:Coproporphyrinogen III oxidase family protein [Shewanella benthica]|uniref:Coproporphyrinogen III oxidase family protein n=1 Tax=Shewanella benthica TaxID=43661 RepID=A0A330LW28_9GAMM|nr:STM4012 family radical SAM protein [Shewanella benthica]SQH74105.1 Coproporphyrinogen III oxidase family protein [Shewanella benthica]